jgi:hypothetical protein
MDARSVTPALFAAVGSLVSLPAAAAEFHVAVNGKGNSGRTNVSPLATSERAREAVRQLKAKGPLPEGGVTVWTHGGAYRLQGSCELVAAEGLPFVTMDGANTCSDHAEWGEAMVQ